jgi:hypothetical protein
MTIKVTSPACRRCNASTVMSRGLCFLQTFPVSRRFSSVFPIFSSLPPSPLPLPPFPFPLHVRVPCTCAPHPRSSCRTYHAGGVCCAGATAAVLVDLPGSVFTSSSCVCVCMLKRTHISFLPACQKHIRVQRCVRIYLINELQSTRRLLGNGCHKHSLTRIATLS